VCNRVIAGGNGDSKYVCNRVIAGGNGDSKYVCNRVSSLPINMALFSGLSTAFPFSAIQLLTRFAVHRTLLHVLDYGQCYSAARGFFCVNRQQHSRMCALKLPQSNEHNKSHVHPRRKTDVGSLLTAVRL
jgi:hypothetical protein